MIQLFIACSLDGFIAREDGSIDWLTRYQSESGEDYGYGEFIKKVGTVIMGRRTYQDLLGFDMPWPYSNCNTLVLSRSESLKIQSPNTQQITEVNEDVLDRLKNGNSSNTWIVGGGEVIKAFLKYKAIDELTISIIPVILGEGIPLFSAGVVETELILIESIPFPAGIVNLKYKLR